MPRDVAPIQLRVDADTKRRYQEAADRAHLSLSEFCRRAADHAAADRLTLEAPSATQTGGKRTYNPDPKQGPKEKR